MRAFPVGCCHQDDQQHNRGGVASGLERLPPLPIPTHFTPHPAPATHHPQPAPLEAQGAPLRTPGSNLGRSCLSLGLQAAHLRNALPAHPMTTLPPFKHAVAITKTTSDRRTVLLLCAPPRSRILRILESGRMGLCAGALDGVICTTRTGDGAGRVPPYSSFVRMIDPGLAANLSEGRRPQNGVTKG